MPLMANRFARVDFTLEQIIQQSRRGEVMVQNNFVAQSVICSYYSQHSPVCCCYLGCGMLALFD